jgi:hypothetical protein
MKTIFFVLIVSAAIMYSCGPAAEDRNAMHARAKVFQDSIANVIKATMAEAEVPVNTTVKVDTAALRVNSATPVPSPTGAGTDSHAGHHH